jgi:hypothetical protein
MTGGREWFPDIANQGCADDPFRRKCMSVFEQLCHAAKRAEEKGIISTQLAERICAISKNHVHYKHLGLEMHGLMARLAPVDGKGHGAAAPALDELVQRLEDRYRRL